jgi:hypothetical protein
MVVSGSPYNSAVQPLRPAFALLQGAARHMRLARPPPALVGPLLRTVAPAPVLRRPVAPASVLRLRHVVAAVLATRRVASRARVHPRRVRVVAVVWLVRLHTRRKFDNSYCYRAWIEPRHPPAQPRARRALLIGRTQSPRVQKAAVKRSGLQYCMWLQRTIAGTNRGLVGAQTGLRTPQYRSPPRCSSSSCTRICSSRRAAGARRVRPRRRWR